MTDYQVRILPRAIQDIEAITSWIHAHSPRGALALVLAFEAAVTRLKRSPEAYSLAPESDYCGMPLRQVFLNPQGQHVPNGYADTQSGSADTANPRSRTATIVSGRTRLRRNVTQAIFRGLAGADGAAD